jgi:hypothetical protein
MIELAEMSCVCMGWNTTVPVNRRQLMGRIFLRNREQAMLTVVVQTSSDWHRPMIGLSNRLFSADLVGNECLLAEIQNRCLSTRH